MANYQVSGGTPGTNLWRRARVFNSPLLPIWRGSVGVVFRMTPEFPLLLISSHLTIPDAPQVIGSAYFFLALTKKYTVLCKSYGIS